MRQVLIVIVVVCFQLCSQQLYAQNVNKKEINKLEKRVNNSFPVRFNDNDSLIFEYLLKNDIERLRNIVSTYILNWCISINQKCELQENIKLSKHLFNDSTIIYELYSIDISIYEDIFDTGNYMDIITECYKNSTEVRIKKLLGKNKKLIDRCIEINGLDGNISE